jgi:hypothetical protein
MVIKVEYGGGGLKQDPATTFTHDYWNVASFGSVEEYGAGRDARLKAMMADTRPEEIHNCDMPRLYKSTNIRLEVAEEG